MELSVFLLLTVCLSVSGLISVRRSRTVTGDSSSALCLWWGEESCGGGGEYNHRQFCTPQPTTLFALISKYCKITIDNTSAPTLTCGTKLTIISVADMALIPCVTYHFHQWLDAFKGYKQGSSLDLYCLTTGSWFNGNKFFSEKQMFWIFFKSVSVSSLRIFLMSVDIIVTYVPCTMYLSRHQ